MIRVLLAEALLVAETSPHEVAILDIRMPKLTGIEVLLHWKELGRNTPTILLTTFDEEPALRHRVHERLQGRRRAVVVGTDLYAHILLAAMIEVAFLSSQAPDPTEAARDGMKAMDSLIRSLIPSQSN